MKKIGYYKILAGAVSASIIFFLIFAACQITDLKMNIEQRTAEALDDIKKSADQRMDTINNFAEDEIKGLRGDIQKQTQEELKSAGENIKEEMSQMKEDVVKDAEDQMKALWAR